MEMEMNENALFDLSRKGDEDKRLLYYTTSRTKEFWWGGS